MSDNPSGLSWQESSAANGSYIDALLDWDISDEERVFIDVDTDATESSGDGGETQRNSSEDPVQQPGGRASPGHEPSVSGSMENAREMSCEEKRKVPDPIFGRPAPACQIRRGCDLTPLPSPRGRAAGALSRSSFTSSAPTSITTHLGLFARARCDSFFSPDVLYKLLTSHMKHLTAVTLPVADFRLCERYVKKS